MFWPMYDNLTRFGTNYAVEPSLATKWDVSADGLTWTFTIRNDVKFSNGDPLTADDVAFTVNEMIAKNWPQRSYFSFVTSAKAVNPTTVDIVSSKVDMSVPNGGPYLWVVPQKYYQAQGGFDGFVKTPIGSGPYELTEFRSADLIKYTKKTTAHPFRAVQASSIEFKAITEPAQVVNGLQTGELDIAAQVNFTGDQLDSIKKQNLNIVSNVSSVSQIGMMQGGAEIRKTPLTDKRVRQAMNYAIDKKAITDAIFKGYAQPVGQVAVPGSLYWDDSVQPYAYNPAQAKQLLAAAGYPNGFKLPVGLDFTPGMTRPDIAVAVQGYLKDVGIEIEVIASEQAIFVDKRYGRNGQLPADLSAGGTGDGNGFFTNTRNFNGCGKPTGGAPEAIGYCNPEWDRLMDAGFAERDPAKRKEFFQQANKVYREDVPVIFLYASPVHVVSGAKVKGITIKNPLAYHFDDAYRID